MGWNSLRKPIAGSWALVGHSLRPPAGKELGEGKFEHSQPWNVQPPFNLEKDFWELLQFRGHLRMKLFAEALLLHVY